VHEGGQSAERIQLGLKVAPTAERIGPLLIVHLPIFPHIRLEAERGGQDNPEFADSSCPD